MLRSGIGRLGSIKVIPIAIHRVPVIVSLAENASVIFDFIIVILDGNHVSSMVRIIVARYARRGELLLAICTLGLLLFLLYTIINSKYLLF